MLLVKLIVAPIAIAVIGAMAVGAAIGVGFCLYIVFRILGAVAGLA